MKNRAKDAQDMSLLMYLAVLLRKQKLVETGYLIDFGVKTCLFYVPRIGLEDRIRIDEIEDAAHGEVIETPVVENGIDTGHVSKHLSIMWKNGQLQNLTLFSPIRVELDVTQKVPYRVVLRALPPLSSPDA